MDFYFLLQSIVLFGLQFQLLLTNTTGIIQDLKKNWDSHQNILLIEKKGKLWKVKEYAKFTLHFKRGLGP